MSKKDSFNSLAHLAIHSVTVDRLASAIELEGFYTWDRFNRFIHIPSNDNDEDNDYSDIRKTVLDALAEGIIADENDNDDFHITTEHLTILEQCGWYESKLPEFEKTQEDWNQKYAGIKVVPERKEPANQSKIWTVLEGVLRLKYSEEVIAELKNPHTDKASMICKQLGTKGVKIDPKTLKLYLQKSKLKIDD